MRWFFENGSIVPVREIRRGRFGVGHCHSNAGWLARRWPDRYEWWAGYAWMPEFGGLDNHSWVRVVEGPHVEVTYDAPSLFYVGVRVPPNLFSRLRESSTFHPNERVALEALGYATALRRLRPEKVAAPTGESFDDRGRGKDENANEPYVLFVE